MRNKLPITIFLVFLIINFCAVHGVIAQDQIGDPILGDSIGDEAGQGLSLNNDGSIVAIGAPFDRTGSDTHGQVRVFENVNGNWVQLGNEVEGFADDIYLGTSVAINAAGTIFIAGDPLSSAGDGGGAAYVFELINDVWTQKGQRLGGMLGGDIYGADVSINDAGDIVAVGDRLSDEFNTNAGIVQVFKFMNGSWVQMGDNIDGSEPFDECGDGISLNASGNRIAVGAPFHDPSGGADGQVRVFEFINGNWVQIGQDIIGETPNDVSGRSVSLNNAGNIVAIGAPNNGDGGGQFPGSIRVFQLTNGIWTQLGQDLDGEDLDRFGEFVSLNGVGNVLIGGGYGYDNDRGRARVYQLINGVWNQAGTDLLGEPDSWFGLRTAISEDGRVVAAAGPADNMETGMVKVYGMSNVLGINTVGSSDFVVYPNPSDGIIYLDSNSAQFTLHTVNVYDQLGRLVHSVNGKQLDDSYTLDLSHLTSSLYFLEIETGQTRTIQSVIIR